VRNGGPITESGVTPVFLRFASSDAASSTTEDRKQKNHKQKAIASMQFAFSVFMRLFVYGFMRLCVYALRYAAARRVVITQGGVCVSMPRTYLAREK
jgi:hypothetical protein